MRWQEVEPGHARIATYHDHRMAMCFATLGLAVPGLKIEDPSCAPRHVEAFRGLSEALSGFEALKGKKKQLSTVNRGPEDGALLFPDPGGSAAQGPRGGALGVRPRERCEAPTPRPEGLGASEVAPRGCRRPEKAVRGAQTALFQAL